eukprot:g2543.t1
MKKWQTSFLEDKCTFFAVIFFLFENSAFSYVTARLKLTLCIRSWLALNKASVCREKQEGERGGGGCVDLDRTKTLAGPSQTPQACRR